MLFNKSTSLFSFIFNIFFIIVIIVIVLAVSFGSNMLVQQVINREKESLNTYASIYRHYITSKDIENSFFFLETITPTIYFPIIITDVNDEPQQDYLSFTLNIDELNDIPSIEKQREYLIKEINRMKQNYSPILVPDENGAIIAKFYYSNSKLTDMLQFFPILSILILVIIIIVGYLAFNTSRNSEQSRVWVGMARETAHQLGTPISSLLGWVELLRFNKERPAIIEATISEVENDIDRLDVITRRFSKIGSKPDIQIMNLSDKIDEVCEYYEKRLPNLKGKITIHKEYSNDLIINSNEMLIGWVFENLIKNAVEAMEGKKGDIYIYTNQTKKMLQIFIKDTGKGMTSKMKYQIFNPGFTTKRRGWGMGLSLVKRIVEDYNKGKIYVKETSISKGTTFEIDLPLPNSIIL